MKSTHNPILDLINQDEHLRKLMVDSFRNQKSSKIIKSTVSLPQSIISKIEKMNADYDYSTKRIIQLLVQTFTFMERYFQNEGENFSQNLLLLRETLLEDIFDPEDLIKKSYLMDKRDSIHLKLIAKISSISRNELISMGVLMVASHMKQHDEKYNDYVEKYKVEFERILSEIQKVSHDATEDLDINDQIVLMAGRLEGHLKMQLIHYAKYQEDGIWYVGPSDSENIDHEKLLSELLNFSEPRRK